MGTLPAGIVAYDGTKLSLTKLSSAMTLTSLNNWLQTFDATGVQLSASSSNASTPAETLTLLP
jgi:hypothetical protein